jgi:hypothetical protein
MADDANRVSLRDQLRDAIARLNEEQQRLDDLEAAQSRAHGPLHEAQSSRAAVALLLPDPDPEKELRRLITEILATAERMLSIAEEASPDALAEEFTARLSRSSNTITVINPRNAGKIIIADAAEELALAFGDLLIACPATSTASETNLRFGGGYDAAANVVTPSTGSPFATGPLVAATAAMTGWYLIVTTALTAAGPLPPAGSYAPGDWLLVDVTPAYMHLRLGPKAVEVDGGSIVADGLTPASARSGRRREEILRATCRLIRNAWIIAPYDIGAIPGTTRTILSQDQAREQARVARIAKQRRPRNPTPEDVAFQAAVHQRLQEGVALADLGPMGLQQLLPEMPYPTISYRLRAYRRANTR